MLHLKYPCFSGILSPWFLNDGHYDNNDVDDDIHQASVLLVLLGVLACLDGYMNIALEQTEEYANGQVNWNSPLSCCGWKLLVNVLYGSVRLVTKLVSNFTIVDIDFSRIFGANCNK